MQIIEFNKKDYSSWNELCQASKSAWFRHTSWFLMYTKHSSFKLDKKNLSFAVLDDSNKLVAVVPLIAQPIYNEPELWEFSMEGTPIPFPALDELTEKDGKKVLKFIFQEIDRLAEEHDISAAHFFVDPLSEVVLNGSLRYNPFLKFGYHNTSLTTNIVGLNKSEEDLLKQCAKGHRTDIIYAEQQGYIVDIFDHSNITKEIFSVYKYLHFLAAGKKTRPDESWDDMFDWIQNNFGILALIRTAKDKDYISGLLTIVYKGKSYYGSGANDPAQDKIRGLGHLLQLETMKYLKQHGCTHYETGWNMYPIISDKVFTLKEVSIGHFKSLFGGEILPLFRGKKFFDPDYFKKKSDNLTKEFIDLYYN